MKRQAQESGLFTGQEHEIEGQQCEPERRLRGWECILLLLRTQVWFPEPTSGDSANSQFQGSDSLWPL